MRWLPLFLDLRARRVVVVGGGPVAERKVDLLLESGATLTLVAPQLTVRLAQRARDGELTHVAREFRAADLDGARLAIAASDAPLVNRAVAIAADARNIFANIVDDAELSSGILPAIVDRSPLIIAIGTEGSAPALARHVRAQIESLLDESIGRLALLLARWRTRLRQRLPDLRARRHFYERVLQGAVADHVRCGREAAAEALLERMSTAGPLDAAAAPPVGRVQLVGAGSGDPGLLTLNALRALQGADVVLHDRLVSEEVLALARREAQRIPVGKSARGHSAEQAQIHELMREHAARGLRVVRLKGGDPFIFGRGGEEVEYLRAQGIAYEIVPGITAALACAAYAGIPLTHRAHAASLRIVTAHCQGAVDAVDWQSLAAGRETLAIYMAVGTVERVESQLLDHGCAPDTPIAFIENGSRATQRVLIGTLRGVAALAGAHAIQSPALLIVGSVAALAAKLHWFGSAPLDARAAVPEARRRSG